MTFDPITLLERLGRAQVQFIVIGGIAAATHGSPTATGDLDICYSREPRNLERLARVLRELKATLRGVSEEVPFLLDAKTLAAGDHFTLTTNLGDLDLLGTPAGTNGYEDLAHAAEKVDLDGISVRIAALADLMRMKRAAGRRKDLVELEILAALQDELSREDRDQ